MNPKISIVIPVLNAKDEIKRCLQSIQEQIFKDFEVIILDAKSSDGTANIIVSYQGKIGRELRYYNELDTGVYDAMNKGISLAKGEWIYFMGADDKLNDENVLTDVFKSMCESCYDMLYGDVLLKTKLQRYGGEWSLDRLQFNENICQQAIFYRQTIFEKLGQFNTRYPIWADWEFNIRCFRHTELQMKWLDRIISVYNDTSGLSFEEDPVLKRELPVIILKELQEQRSNVANITNKLSYLLGKKFFGWLD